MAVIGAAMKDAMSSTLMLDRGGGSRRRSSRSSNRSTQSAASEPVQSDRAFRLALRRCIPMQQHLEMCADMPVSADVEKLAPLPCNGTLVLGPGNAERLEFGDERIDHRRGKRRSESQLGREELKRMSYPASAHADVDGVPSVIKVRRHAIEDERVVLL